MKTRPLAVSIPVVAAAVPSSPVEFVRRAVDRELKRADETLARFSAQFAKSPFNAFDYSSCTEAMSASAVKMVFESFAAELTKQAADGTADAWLPTAVEWLTRNVIGNARSPRFASGATSAAMERMKMAAEAELLDVVTRAVEK